MKAKILDKSIASFLETNQFNIDWTKDFIYEIQKSDISINDIILDEKSRKQITQIILEYKNSHKLKEFNWLTPVNKIILEWESWCWKTSTALALANSLNKWMIIVNLSEIISSKLWETSKNLNKVFKYADNNNCIILLDEFDSLSKSRNDEKELWEMKRLVNSIIQLLDFWSEDLIIIWATNYIDNLDIAIKRRFEAIISFSKPDIHQIKTYLEMLQFHFEGKVKISISKKMIDKFIGLDFFRIKTIINNVIKDKIIHGWKNKINVNPEDIAI